MDVPVENYNLNAFTVVIWLGGIIVAGVTSALVVVWRKWLSEMKERKLEVKMMTEIFDKIAANQDLTTKDIEYMKRYAEDTKPVINNIDKNVEKIVS